jgi:hypothetical protein
MASPDPEGGRRDAVIPLLLLSDLVLRRCGGAALLLNGAGVPWKQWQLGPFWPTLVFGPIVAA